jgi:hypothetical protein
VLPQCLLVQLVIAASYSHSHSSMNHQDLHAQGTCTHCISVQSFQAFVLERFDSNDHTSPDLRATHRSWPQPAAVLRDLQVHVFSALGCVRSQHWVGSCEGYALRGSSTSVTHTNASRHPQRRPRTGSLPQPICPAPMFNASQQFSTIGARITSIGYIPQHMLQLAVW